VRNIGHSCIITIYSTVFDRSSGVMKSTLPNHFIGPASAKSRLLEMPKPFFAPLNGTSDSECHLWAKKGEGTSKSLDFALAGPIK